MPRAELVPIRLSEPSRGGQTMEHDETFTAWDETFSALRDTVNAGIDLINKAGAGLPRLPEGSLEEMLVLPLSGDYPTIAQNAAACGDVREALHTWGDNIVRISLAVDPDWGGKAAAAYLLRVNAIGLAARGIGEIVAAGAVAFEAAADGAERIGIAVEKLIVELATTLVRLGRRLAAKIGPVGPAVFVAELITKGLDAITDIVDDVKKVVELIDTLFELYDEVVAFAEEMRGRLDVLTTLRGVDWR